MSMKTLQHEGRVWDVAVHPSADRDTDRDLELVFVARGEPVAKVAAPVGRLALDQITSGGGEWVEAMLRRLLSDTIRDRSVRATERAEQAPTVRLQTRSRTALRTMRDHGVAALPVLAADGSCAGVVLRAGLERGCVGMQHPEDCTVLSHLKRDVELVLEGETSKNVGPGGGTWPRVVLSRDGRPTAVVLGG